MKHASDPDPVNPNQFLFVQFTHPGIKLNPRPRRGRIQKGKGGLDSP